MKFSWRGVLASVGLVVGMTSGSVAQVYNPPESGWAYTYNGDAATAGTEEFTSLDGTWDHANGSDEWDGSGIGSGNPGGITGGLTDEGDATVYTRFQETGDPRDHGMDDPGSNRKLYLGHDLSGDVEGAVDTILDDGVTLSFRARIATGGLLDDQHPDGGGAISPWPAEGVGYNIHNGSKSMFTIKQQSGGSVSFALALPSSEGSPSPGIVTNNLNGDAASGDVDGFDDAGNVNFMALDDATEWHEFWVTVEQGGAGTHQVNIWRDGTAFPATYDVTAGNGSDYGDISYLAIGLGATPRMGAFDMDFFSWAPGALLPFDSIPERGDFNLDGNINEDDYAILAANIGLHTERSVLFEDGDFDVDGDVDLDDFGQFKAVAPAVVAAATGVPEPATWLVLCIAVLAGLGIRRRAFGLTAVFVLVGSVIPAVTAQEANWVGTTGDYNVGSNWDINSPPFGAPGFDESGNINNGGIAQLSGIASGDPVDLNLGNGDGTSGTLEVQAGGQMTTLADLIVGNGGGEGHLVMDPGSTLNVTANMRNLGAEASSVRLGSTGGGDPATLQVGAEFEMQRNLHITGPNVDISVGSLIFGGEGTYTAEITGPDHSAIVATGGASLAGALELEFNGHEPTADDSWTLVDASSINGGFSSVNAEGVDLDPGFGYFVNVYDGGTQGRVANLELEGRLQLSVDSETGAASIENITTTETFDIDGYLITSSLDGLTPAGWTSVADGGDAAWVESNASATRLAETNLSGSMSIGPGNSVPLGTIVSGGSLDGLIFSYHEAGGISKEGFLASGEIMPPDGIAGDYDNSGQVEQGDLDLVLLNWGDTIGDPVSIGWTNDLPSGQIDQGELDGVLLNWGNTAGLAAAAAVPEPSSLMILFAGGLVGLLAARQRCV